MKRCLLFCVESYSFSLRLRNFLLIGGLCLAGVMASGQRRVALGVKPGDGGVVRGQGGAAGGVQCSVGGVRRQMGRSGARQRAGSAYVSKVWVSDRGDGTYRNPVLYADYSDPDACRVGDDFYMVASSFDAVPGLPILHSKDLVNWALIGHALPLQLPLELFWKTQHGNGVWAPAIRFHKGSFYIYYPDPDAGIYMMKATRITGPWSVPVLVYAGKGLIDPCPLWDDDGRVYLVHAWAGSRAGIKSLLTVNRMNAAGTSVVDEGVLVYDGHDLDPTVEGPKLYKRHGFYYLFAPAGGVGTGWQIVLRSRNVYGPYERRVVMDQGRTLVNGPHQGAWVETPNGASWFLHFQDLGPYGRVTHLQPMRWVNDWPVIGDDKDGDGKGEPVLTYVKPDVGRAYAVQTPVESDEFNGHALGLQWQWQANPRGAWYAPSGAGGYVRLFAVPVPDSARSLWDVPNVLLQKWPAERFTVTTKLTFKPRLVGERCGLVVMGSSYAYVGLVRRVDGVYMVMVTCADAEHGGKEVEQVVGKVDGGAVYLRLVVGKGAVCGFGVSADGVAFKECGAAFTATAGRWIGAKMGLFCVGRGKTNDEGWVDADWWRVE